MSRLGFGTASLHHCLTSRTRQRLLETAFECGVRHFDTAPYYGHGLAEAELGQFGRARRSSITIASKFGIEPNAFYQALPPLMYAAKLARGTGLVAPAPPPKHLVFAKQAATRAERSLVATLRRLRTDYLDLLFLHEPPFELSSIPEELLSWAESVRSRGLARALGIAGNAYTACPLSHRAGALSEVLQVEDSLVGHEADQVLRLGRPLQITYGYFRKGLKAHPCDDPIARAMRRNTHGVVLFSSISPSRIEHNCKGAYAIREVQS